MSFYESYQGQGGFFRDLGETPGTGPYRHWDSTRSRRFTERLIKQGRLASYEANGAIAIGVSLGFSEILAGGMKNLTGEIGEAVKTFAENMRYAANRRYGLAEVHRQVAFAAQQEIIRAYDGIKRGPVYRIGQDRYAGGKLRDALGNREFYLANRDGIQFINERMLDNKAAQWHRYNFGAGFVSGPGARNYSMRFFGAAVGEFGLRGETASRHFMMPRGIFLQPGSGKPVPHGAGKRQEFYTQKWYLKRAGTPGTYKEPGKNAQSYNPMRFVGPPMETRGIRGRQVFDAGTRYLAKNLPQAYEGVIHQWFHDAAFGAERGGFGPLGKAGVTPDKALRHMVVVASNLGQR